MGSKMYQQIRAAKKAKGNIFLGDTAEDIRDCLNCRRPKCTNCKDSAEAKGRLTERERFRRDLLSAYEKCNTVREMQLYLLEYRGRIVNTLERLGLPYPETLTAAERKRLVRERNG